MEPGTWNSVSHHQTSPESSGSDVERRYLTILIVDLVGFTELSEQLDPEDLRTLQKRFQTLTLRLMERFGGFVARFTGDGALVYFGYPAAHENDAERALRAALTLIDRLPHMDTRLQDLVMPPLVVRIGVHTGLGLIEPEVMSGGPVEHGVTGEVVNLAARLQVEAPPGGIVVSQETLDLVAGLFDVERLGERAIKGLSRKVALYRVLSAIPGAKRSPQRYRDTTPMVGRDAALSTLRACWRAVLAEKRLHRVTISGEAGLGKTRLVREFCSELDPAQVSILQTNCHQMFASTPLYPVASSLWARARLSVAETESARQQKISDMLSEIGLDTPENRELMGSLLGLALTGVMDAAAPTSQLLKQKQYDFLIALIAQTAHARPTVLWIEDVHWLDPSSAELLGEMLRALPDTPLLVIQTRRPFPKGPDLSDGAELIELDRLSRGDCLIIARAIPGAADLADGVLAYAVDAAEGVPLFVEQMTLSLAESEMRAPPQARKASGVPLMLAEMMTERLDRRPDARSAVRAAACIGRSFLPDLLAEVLDKPSEAVTETLQGLVEAEIMQARRHGVEIRYEFRHALLQRIAYESVVQGERQALHARIVEILNRRSAMEPPLPEVVAHHLTEAGVAEAAAGAWLKAGVAAAQRSAHAEAIEQIRRGLALLNRLPDPARARQLELQLQAAMMGSLVAIEGATSIRVSECCHRGLQLCAQGEPTPLVFAFTFGQFTSTNCRGQVDEAAALARTFLDLGEKARNESVRVVGHRMLGTVLFGQARAAEAREQLELSRRLYVPARDAATTHMFGQNTEVHTKSSLSLVLFCLGEIEEALAIGVDALRSADMLRHPHSTAIPLTYVGGWVFGLSGATGPMMDQAARLIALADQHRLGAFKGHGMALLGWALCQRGELADGAAAIERGIAMLDSIDFRLAISGYLGMYADVQRQLGNIDAAKRSASRAIAQMAASSFLWLEPELRRIEALVALADPAEGADAAEAKLRQAADIARRLGFPVMERRCLASLSATLAPSRRDAAVETRLAELASFGDLAARVSRAVGA